MKKYQCKDRAKYERQHLLFTAPYRVNPLEGGDVVTAVLGDFEKAKEFINISSVGIGSFYSSALPPRNQKPKIMPKVTHKIHQSEPKTVIGATPQVTTADPITLNMPLLEPIASIEALGSLPTLLSEPLPSLSSPTRYFFGAVPSHSLSVGSFNLDTPLIEPLPPKTAVGPIGSLPLLSSLSSPPSLCFGNVRSLRLKRTKWQLPREIQPKLKTEAPMSVNFGPLPEVLNYRTKKLRKSHSTAIFDTSDDEEVVAPAVSASPSILESGESLDADEDATAENQNRMSIRCLPTQPDFRTLSSSGSDKINSSLDDDAVMPKDGKTICAAAVIDPATAVLLNRSPVIQGHHSKTSSSPSISSSSSLDSSSSSSSSSSSPSSSPFSSPPSSPSYSLKCNRGSSDEVAIVTKQNISPVQLIGSPGSLHSLSSPASLITPPRNSSPFVCGTMSSMPDLVGMEGIGYLNLSSESESEESDKDDHSNTNSQHNEQLLSQQKQPSSKHAALFDELFGSSPEKMPANSVPARKLLTGKRHRASSHEDEAATVKKPRRLSSGDDEEIAQKIHLDKHEKTTIIKEQRKQKLLQKQQHQQLQQQQQLLKKPQQQLLQKTQKQQPKQKQQFETNAVFQTNQQNPHLPASAPSHSQSAQSNVQCLTPQLMAVWETILRPQPQQPIYRSYLERSDKAPNNDFSMLIEEATMRQLAAEKEQNSFNKSSLYLEAIIYYLLSGAAIESESAAMNIYKDTLGLIKNNCSNFLQGQHEGQFDSQDKVTILSLRCQSLLLLKLYKMQRVSYLNMTTQCSNYFESHKSEINNGNTPSSISSSDKVVSREVHSGLQQQHQLFSYLSSSHDLWNQADSLVRNGSHTDFFVALDHKNGPLTLHSSMCEVFHYVQAGLRALHGHH